MSRLYTRVRADVTLPTEVLAHDPIERERGEIDVRLSATNWRMLITAGMTILGAATLLPSKASSWETKSIYRPVDYYDLQGVIRRDGALYGTATSGGVGTDCGAVYKLTSAGEGQPWKRTLLHAFAGGDGDGCRPTAELLMDDNGAVYGTTRLGGLSNCSTDGDTCGTVFKLTPRPEPAPWKLTILHKFKGGVSGFYPRAPLIFGQGGALFGTTSGNCNIAGSSTVFRLSPPESGTGKWKHEVLYTGVAIAAPVASGADGMLYGTDPTCLHGRVFRLEPPVPPKTKWRFRLLHEFTDGLDGTDPRAGVTLDDAGAVYGTAGGGGSSGFGTVYRLTPRNDAATKWTFDVLHDFGSSMEPDGIKPLAELLLNPQTGALYGTTQDGEAGPGTIFQLAPTKNGSPPWKSKVLWTSQSFDDPLGFFVESPLIFGDSLNELFGTTSRGPPSVLRLTK
jgi:uncharacterized repeat protein (TIGR03803 family)